ncbi:hypothetical protein N7457_000123 [Penicillium paradoxum]|uniref:uncharacterized protein n=1 Tax=Penicillium paradoxum TaxID=176176 RepID=UPI00254835E0|nr:uncharacterized protein N7457_000123 [Penicillium paradoxum]KAJ5793524.1 hypothetical protein N7457_000123 [Penicillium paradoxum]
MRASIIIAAVIGSLGAQAKDSSSIFGYFSPSWEDSQFTGGWTSTAASIAGIDAKATTYHVGCVKDAPKSLCNYASSWTIIQGPETVDFKAKYIASSSGKDNSYDFTITETYACSLKSWTESASCSMSMSIGGEQNGGSSASSSSTKTTYTTAPKSDMYYQLTVTGGLESLATATATATADIAAGGPAGSLITAAPLVAAAVVAML